MSVLDNEVIKETVAQTEQENVHMRNKAVTPCLLLSMCYLYSTKAGLDNCLKLKIALATPLN
jgi:hypothetical protein